MPRRRRRTMRASMLRPRAGTDRTCSRSRTTSNAAQTNFLLAEVLYESGNFRDAASEYERTAYAYPFHDNAGEAGYAALLAYAKHEDELSGARARRVAPPRHRQRAEVRRDAIRPTHRPPPCRPTPPRSCSRSASSRARATSASKSSRASPPVEPALQRTAWTVIAHSEFDLQDFAAAETAYVQLLGADACDRSAARRDHGARRVVDLQAGRAGPHGWVSSTSPSATSCAWRRRLRRRRCARRPSTTRAPR